MVPAAERRAGGAGPDNGWGQPGALIYFAATGAHTLRIQQREDGPFVDQIVLSPDTYITNAPGPRFADSTILPETAAAAAGTALYDRAHRARRATGRKEAADRLP